jgi:hypothetical protein
MAHSTAHPSRVGFFVPVADASLLTYDIVRLRDVGLLLLMMIGTIVFLPVLVPAAGVYASMRGWRMRRAAETFGCVECGMPLTAQAVRWADREHREHMDALRRTHPNCIFRIVRTCHAICPGCGTRYTYLERERTFTREAAHTRAHAPAKCLS